MKTKLKAVSLTVLAALMFAPMQVLATYPGFNGVIYFIQTDESGIHTLTSMHPDGSNLKTLKSFGTTFQRYLTVSADGKTLLYSNQGQTITKYNTSDGQETDLGAGWDPAWSPDGNKLAFLVEESVADGEQELYTMNADGSSKEQITSFGDEFVHEQSFSADGTKIAFHTTTSDFEDNAIYVISSDGSGLTPVITTELYNPLLVNDPWLDDDTLIFTAQDPDDSSRDVFSVDTDGSNIQNITGYDTDKFVFGAYLSPDKSHIAHQYDNGSEVITEIIPAAGGEAVIVHTGSSSGSGGLIFDSWSNSGLGIVGWSPDSTQLMFTGSLILYSLSNASLQTIYDGSAGSVWWSSSLTPLTGIRGSVNPVPFIAVAAGLGLAGTVYLKKRQKLPHFKLSSK